MEILKVRNVFLHVNTHIFLIIQQDNANLIVILLQNFLKTIQQRLVCIYAHNYQILMLNSQRGNVLLLVRQDTP